MQPPYDLLHALGSQLGRNATVTLAWKFRAQLRDSLLQRIARSAGARPVRLLVRGTRHDAHPRQAILPGQLEQSVTEFVDYYNPRRYHRASTI